MVTLTASSFTPAGLRLHCIIIIIIIVIVIILANILAPSTLHCSQPYIAHKPCGFTLSACCPHLPYL